MREVVVNLTKNTAVIYENDKAVRRCAYKRAVFEHEESVSSQFKTGVMFYIDSEENPKHVIRPSCDLLETTQG